MIKITKFYPKDLIAIIALLACFFLMAIGVNHVVSLIIIMIISFYFARRFDGEGVPGKDLNEKVNKLEEDVRTTLPFKSDSISEPPAPKPFIATKLPPAAAKTTGDFKPTLKRIQ